MNSRFFRWAGALLALVASVHGGSVYLETRYAKSAEVREQFNTVKQSLTEGQLQQLEREQFELRREKEKRALTDLELQRLGVIERQIKRLRGRLKGGKQ